jgi:hypothetical protein
MIGSYHLSWFNIDFAFGWLDCFEAYYVADVSEEHATSVYSHNTPHFILDDRCSMFLWNVCNTTHFHVVNTKKLSVNHCEVLNSAISWYNKFVVHVDGLRPRPWTAATNGHFFHPPDDIWAPRATVEWYWQESHTSEKSLYQYHLMHHKSNMALDIINLTVSGEEHKLCLSYFSSSSHLLFHLIWFEICS